MLHHKLLIEPTDSCIEWTGAFHKNGYGVLSLNRKVASEMGLSRVQFVHRMSYLQNIGPLVEGMVIRHQCHNRACFNPRHLLQGTQLENYEDSVRTGANKRKLSLDDVTTIRNSAMSNRKLATMYGVSSTTIHKIKHNLKWRVSNG